jgi:hypothetical protein
VKIVSVAKYVSAFLFAAGLLITATPLAQAQSLAALAGMQAYNRGDIQSAYRLLRAAADAGDAEGEVNLGYMYARGQVVAENQQEAFRLYKLSAGQGDGEGMNALGYKYRFGTGVAANPEQAVHWFCMAVAYGNPRAMNNLGGMLASGDYVTQDLAEARSLWEQAAALGHSNAMMNLARSYAMEPGADAAKVQQWVLTAAQHGNPAAIQMLQSRGYTGMLPPQFDETALMIPSVKGKSGHTKVCGLTS